MADTKISALPSAGALSGTEPVPIVQGGNTVKTTVQDVANLVTTPDLQQVTDVGFTTNNRLLSDDGAGNYTEVGNGYVLIATGNTGDVQINSSQVTASYTAQLPDKPTSPQTFAMLSDIPSGVLALTTYLSQSGTVTATATSGINAYFFTGAGSLVLPTAVGNTAIFKVKNAHSANITVTFTGGQNADGTTSITLIPNQALEFISNNVNYNIF